MPVDRLPPKEFLELNIEWKHYRYQSFDQTMDASWLFRVIPKNTDDILAVVNCAAKVGYTVRAIGGEFTWFPGLVDDFRTDKTNKADSPVAKLFLLEMKDFMCFVDEPDLEGMTIRCGAGATMGKVLGKLKDKDVILSSYPADGDLTVGGIITAGSHGSVCTDVPDIGSNPHGSLANMVTEYVAVVWDKEKNEYSAQTFDRSTDKGRAYLITFGRILILEAKIRIMKNYNACCDTTVARDFDKVFAFPPADNPVPQGSFAHFALNSGRYSALSMPMIDTVWHRNVYPCQEKPGDSQVKEITEPYSFPYMAGLPLWQQALAKKSIGVPHESIAAILAKKWGPESHKGGIEKVADKINDFSQRFQDAFGITNILQMTTSATSYITKATIEIGDFLNKLSHTWGQSQNLMLCVRDTLRMRSFGVVIVTSRNHLQTAAATSMKIIHESLRAQAKDGIYPVALPVEFRASGLDDDVESGAPMLSFIRKDEKAKANGWDVAIAIEVVHYPSTYGCNRYMEFLEKALVDAPALSGNNARVVANWGKSFAYTPEGPWHTQARLEQLRADNAEWDKAVDLIEEADPKGVTASQITKYVLRKKGTTPLVGENQPLPWDTKYGRDKPGCCGRCFNFWCCCCA